MLKVQWLVSVCLLCMGSFAAVTLLGQFAAVWRYSSRGYHPSEAGTLRNREHAAPYLHILLVGTSAAMAGSSACQAK
jgi:hypothetical protein